MHNLNFTHFFEFILIRSRMLTSFLKCCRSAFWALWIEMPSVGGAQWCTSCTYIVLTWVDCCVVCCDVMQCAVILCDIVRYCMVPYELMCILALAILSCLATYCISLSTFWHFFCFDNVRTVHRKECTREILSAVRTRHTAHTAYIVIFMDLVLAWHAEDSHQMMQHWIT
jgi:hypothetical protein